MTSTRFWATNPAALLGLSALLTGCSPTQTGSPPASPAAAAYSAPSPATKTVNFVYPKNMSNYVWSLQTSTDLIHWHNVATNFQGTVSNYYYSVPGTNAHCFYRMAGHDR